VEALMAMSILSVGMLGTGALALGVVRANMVSKNVTAATALAEDKMAGIQEIGYRGLPSSDATETEDFGSIDFTPVGGAGQVPEGEEPVEGEEGYGGLGASPVIVAEYGAFKRVTSTQAGAPVAGMKTVTVSVYWRAGQNPIVLKRIFAE